MRRIATILALSLCAVLTSCTHRLVDFTLISTKSLDWSQASKFKRGTGRVTGEDPIYIIIFIPTGARSDMKEAIDRAIESVPGAVGLVDGVISLNSFYIPFIYGRTAFIAEGIPLIDPMIARAEGPIQSSHMLAVLDSDGEVEEFRFLEAEEYAELRAQHMATH